MKKIVWLVLGILLVSFLTGGLLLAQPYAFTVGTNAVTVLPPRPIKSATAWATNTAYLNGQIVEANRQYWMCITNGTSHTSGTGPTGSGIQSDGTLNWRSINKGPRRGYSIVNDSTNTLYLSVGSTAVANQGHRLNSDGGWFSMSASDGDAVGSKITVIGSTTNNNVTVEEW